MTAERERQETIKVTEQVADEGNVPGTPFTSALILIALILFLGLALMHVASMYGPSHVPWQTQSSR